MSPQDTSSSSGASKASKQWVCEPCRVKKVRCDHDQILIHGLPCCTPCTRAQERAAAGPKKTKKLPKTRTSKPVQAALRLPNKQSKRLADAKNAALKEQRKKQVQAHLEKARRVAVVQPEVEIEHAPRAKAELFPEPQPPRRRRPSYEDVPRVKRVPDSGYVSRSHHGHFVTSAYSPLPPYLMAIKGYYTSPVDDLNMPTAYYPTSNVRTRLEDVADESEGSMLARPLIYDPQIAE